MREPKYKMILTYTTDCNRLFYKDVKSAGERK